MKHTPRYTGQSERNAARRERQAQKRLSRRGAPGFYVLGEDLLRAAGCNVAKMHMRPPQLRRWRLRLTRKRATNVREMSRRRMCTHGPFADKYSPPMLMPVATSSELVKDYDGTGLTVELLKSRYADGREECSVRLVQSSFGDPRQTFILHHE